MLSSYPTDIGPIPGKSLRQIAAKKERANPSKKPDTVFQVTPHIRSVNGKLETVIPGADAAKQHQGAQDKKLPFQEDRITGTIYKHKNLEYAYRYEYLGKAPGLLYVRLREISGPLIFNTPLDFFLNHMELA